MCQLLEFLFAESLAGQEKQAQTDATAALPAHVNTANGIERANSLPGRGCHNREPAEAGGGRELLGALQCAFQQGERGVVVRAADEQEIRNPVTVEVIDADSTSAAGDEMAF